jgi:hypothetical protein
LRQLFPFADDFQVVLGIALVRKQYSSSLANIKRAASAEPNDQMTIRISRTLGGLADSSCCWLAGHMEHGILDSVCGEFIKQRVCAC